MSLRYFVNNKDLLPCVRSFGIVEEPDIVFNDRVGHAAPYLGNVGIVLLAIVAVAIGLPSLKRLVAARDAGEKQRW